MERLTYRHEDQRGNPTNSISPALKFLYTTQEDWVKKVATRLALIEDILGDDYDLDSLRELVEADRELRCIVIPDFVWKIGETQGVIKVQYRSWMGRFIGTKFFRTEKEAKEAALKGDQNGIV